MDLTTISRDWRCRRRQSRPATEPFRQHTSKVWLGNRRVWLVLAVRVARRHVGQRGAAVGAWPAEAIARFTAPASLAILAFVLDELSLQYAGKAPGDLVFAGPLGGYLPWPKSSNGWFAGLSGVPGCSRSRRTN
jgi:hypothetical protein